MSSPAVTVEGIESWHADHDHLCLWQQGDNTKAWVTVEGIIARIDEWATQAQDDFGGFDGAAL